MARPRPKKKWRIVQSIYAKRGSGELTKRVEVITVYGRKHSKYEKRTTFFKKGKIKYRYGSRQLLQDVEYPWMIAPAKYKKRHRKKR